MASNYFTDNQDKKVTAGSKRGDVKRSEAKHSMPMKTAAWPGLPGKGSPDRSGGTKKVKAYPKSEGI